MEQGRLRQDEKKKEMLDGLQYVHLEMFLPETEEDLTDGCGLAGFLDIAC